MKIVLASDHGGVNLRQEIAGLLQEMNIAYDDMGCDCEGSVDYPDYGIPAAEKVAAGDYDLGILICGTGIGMTISANKVKGIRCALVHDVFSAKMTKAHNNANVIAMGERVIGPGLAKEIVKAWLETEFEGGRHENRIGKITEYENK
ncbi:ribose 5-phosphate isomerase B [Virgibacillus sp. MSP4-1]|uniref:ribose 5-phosphate isomerase B n=1 Tax=Virgibacillus sp. MSP4-1 TaxID=2700081 RepID=UPI0003A33621|nr:ribose 5-phosphate isomerase B [Virgibacillus sp. MSP4-1]QHS23572.1 ribose 5-phosphate isomerase B [Virgibacillus sp. MSP4-1]